MIMMICFQTSDRDKLLSEFSQFVKVTVNEEEQAVHKLLGKQFQVIVIGPDKIVCAPKISFIFIPINLNMCFEYPKHTFWIRNKKIIFQYTLLSGGLNSVTVKYPHKRE